MFGQGSVLGGGAGNTVLGGALFNQAGATGGGLFNKPQTSGTGLMVGGVGGGLQLGAQAAGGLGQGTGGMFGKLRHLVLLQAFDG